MMINFKENPLLIYPNFRNLFCARVISAVGDKFFTLALVWWVINEKGEFALSLTMAATFLPAVLFSPLAGIFADRYPKKHIMISADLMRAFFLLIILLLLYESKLTFNILLILVFLIYSFSPFFETSTASSLILTTSQKHLPQATAIDSSSISISNVVGAALGSVFIAYFGFSGSVLSNIITYLLSFCFVLMIKDKLKSKDISQHGFREFFNDLKDGFIYLKNELPTILNLLIFFAFLNFFVSPVLILIPVIVKSILNESVRWLAIIETFFAFGSLLAPFIMSFKKDTKGNLTILFITIVFFSTSLLISAFSKNRFFTTFLFLICGFSISLGNVAIISYFQTKVKNEYKGRFFSLVNMIVYAIMPISFIFNGFLLSKLNPSYVISYNSIFSIILFLIGIKKFLKKGGEL